MKCPYCKYEMSVTNDKLHQCGELVVMYQPMTVDNEHRDEKNKIKKAAKLQKMLIKKAESKARKADMGGI